MKSDAILAFIIVHLLPRKVLAIALNLFLEFTPIVVRYI
jgi:hypothetical protein